MSIVLRPLLAVGLASFDGGGGPGFIAEGVVFGCNLDSQLSLDIRPLVLAARARFHALQGIIIQSLHVLRTFLEKRAHLIRKPLRDKAF
jgi:hypothetical protein